jgi:site-specific recombinase XerC
MKEGSEPMASLRKHGANWYFRYIGPDGKQRERKGCSDRRATEQMAAAAEAESGKIKSGYITGQEAAARAAEKIDLTEHLDAYHRHLMAKGRTARHANLTRNRARRVIDLAKAKRINDLTPTRIQAALAALCDEGLSLASANHHLRAVKMLARWLWKEGRSGEDRLAGLSQYNADSDRRRIRRALTPAEATRLIRAAEEGREVMGMAGPDRAALYAVALGSGFRASEIRSLTPEAFRLDERPPVIVCAASATKNRRRAEQPIPAALAARLAGWMVGKKPGRPVFESMPRLRTAALLRHDLAAAGIAYETDSGVADFHSLRACYITYLIQAGASVKTVQTLARHSKAALTIDLYAKASVHDLTGAVESLPALAAPASEKEADTLAATGTDGSISNRLSLPFPYGGDGGGRISAVAGYRGDFGQDERNPAVIAGLCASVRSDSERRRPDSNRGITDLQSAGTAAVSPDDATAKPSISEAASLSLPYEAAKLPPDLASVVDAWALMPEAIRAAILAMIRAARPEEEPARNRTIPDLPGRRDR